MTAGGKYIEGDLRHLGDCSNKETNTLENRVNFGTATNRRPASLGENYKDTSRPAISISNSGPWGGKPRLTRMLANHRQMNRDNLPEIIGSGVALIVTPYLRFGRGWPGPVITP